jgi:uncharacterized protein YdhG (YjbR/CyaY superfamily)
VSRRSDVEAYLAAVPSRQRTVLEELRRTIRSVVPDATETISYRMPAFMDRDGRSLVWYAAFKDHCSLFPASEGAIKALGKELEPYLSGKGTLRFTVDDPMPTELVEKFVRARVEENEARGATYRRARTHRPGR